MILNYEEAKEILKEYKQEHLLKSYEKLNEENKKKLLKQISEINFEEINNLYKKAITPPVKENKKIEPIEYIEKNKINEEEKQRYEKHGIEIIKEGKMAIVTMAGGQGTRLRP